MNTPTLPSVSVSGRIVPRYRNTPVYQRVLTELRIAAEYRGVTTYKKIAALMDLPSSGHYMSRELGQIFGEIVEDEIAQGRPMLSAVVVSATGDVGDGFFAFASECRLLSPDATDEDKESFLRAERAAVYASWKREEA